VRGGKNQGEGKKIEPQRGKTPKNRSMRGGESNLEGGKATWKGGKVSCEGGKSDLRARRDWSELKKKANGQV